MAKVFIGVGHGGADAGAVKYVVEKDINLKIALACRDYLLTRGVDVTISRDADITDHLSDKIKRCNQSGADLAIDIHNNAGGGHGFEVYHSVAAGTGKTLAQNIEEEVKAIGQMSRGCKTRKGANGDYFGFIRQTKMPAVICEGVFVDNEADAAKVKTDAGCKAFGEAYAKGILKTLGVEDVNHIAKIVKDEQKHPCLVRVTVDALRIRSGPGTEYKETGVIRGRGVYTIVDVNEDETWGRLKSGAGWICMSHTKRI